MSSRGINSPTPVREIPALMRYAITLLLCWPLLASANWNVTQFEVFFGEPWYISNPDLTEIGRFLEDEYDFTLDEGQPQPSFVSQATVQEIERYLHETAELYKSMGLRGPMLEPLVKRADGQWAYRVYLHNMDGGAPARYGNGYHGGDVRRLIEVDLEAGAGPGNVIDGSGKITDKGYQDLAHELFHAVQAAYPIFTDDCTLGDWIVEGTAQAVGADTARVLRKIDPRDLGSLGVRRYNEALRVEDDPVCLETSADGRGCAGKNDGYWTASLWRYLGEMNQQKGAFPPTTFVEPDYGYLDNFFSTRLTGAPSEATELAWLDNNLAGPQGFGKSLDRVYSTFTTAFSAYPKTRLAKAGAPAAPGRETRWLDTAFGSCPELRINPGEPPLLVPVELNTVAAACLRLSSDTGGPLHVQVTAHPRGGAALQDLWVGTQAGLAVGQPLLVRVKDTGFAEWRFRLELAPTDSTTLVISNVAGDAENSAAQALDLRLTASVWTKNLGTP